MTAREQQRVTIALQDLMAAITEVTGRVPFRDSCGQQTTVAVELADGRVLDISDLTGEDLHVTLDSDGRERVEVLGFALRSYCDMATFREVAGWQGRGFSPPDLDCLAGLVAGVAAALR